MSLHRLANFAEKLILLLLLVSLTACATAQKPLTGIIPGREVETLESAIGVTVKSGERSTGGRGYMVFKRPDRFHMVMLSPFGLTVFEVFGDGDRLTCLVPPRQTAYSGLMSELPENSALKSLAMLNWVVAPPPLTDDVSSRVREVTTASGERFYVDKRGLVERKVSQQGDEVVYENYRSVNGVAFPESIVIESRLGASVKISFDDPEINLPVEDSVLTPNLEGYTLQPLAAFRGF